MTVQLPKAHERLDALFAHHARARWPAVDWRLIKAVAIAESTLNASATSHAGALGLMQLLPDTFREALPAAYRARHPFDVDANVAAGVCYLREQFDRLPEIHQLGQRILAALAAYNCGRGYINAAIRIIVARVREGIIAPGPIAWNVGERRLDRILHAARVRGRPPRADQVLAYVDRITGLYRELRPTLIPVPPDHLPPGSVLSRN